MFAKLYETVLGQILVKVDTNDKDGTEVRYFFEPEGYGVCTVALEFIYDAEGSAWDKADAAFIKVDEDSALQFVENIVRNMFNK